MRKCENVSQSAVKCRKVLQTENASNDLHGGNLFSRDLLGCLDLINPKGLNLSHLNACMFHAFRMELTFSLENFILARHVQSCDDSPQFGSSQTRSYLFQTWLFASFTQKRALLRCFAPFCVLLHSFADLRLRSIFFARSRSFACFCIRPHLERPRLGTVEL